MTNLQKKAIAAIEEHGCLLVFAHQNRPEPKSLWSTLYPRSKMVWEWNEDSDRRIEGLWHLREQLSRSGQVVYSKWYQNKATFMSKDIFVDLLSILSADSPRLSLTSERILECLKMDSPLSTKQIKEAVELQGRWLESEYNRAMKSLWNRLQIVAWGEIHDSSFPSLAVGATENIFEELWLKSQSISCVEALKRVEKKLGADSLWIKHLRRIQKTKI